AVICGGVLAGWRRLRPGQRWLWVGGGVMVLVVVGLGLRPVYGAARTWRAETLARAAMGLGKEGRIPEALARAHAAYQLAPVHPPVARTLAELYEAVHPGRARDLWRALLADGKVPESDRIRAADFFLRSGLWEEAREALMPLGASPVVTGEACEMLARLAMAQGNWTEAERWVARGMAANPGREVEQRLKRLAAEAGWAQGGRVREETLTEALREAGAGGEGLEVVKWLATRPELTPGQASEILTVLEQAGADRTLAGFDARLRQDPRESGKVFAEVVETHREEVVEKVAEAGRWLNQRGGAGAVPELISEEAAGSRRDLFLIRADALALQGRWGDLERLLQDPSIPLERVFVRAFQFRVALAQGRENQAEIFWERALQETNRQPDLLWYLASYAERLGRLDQAEAAYRRLAQDAGAARLAYLAWARLLESVGQTERLRRLMGEIAERYPNEPAPRNDLLYLDLLTGQSARERLEEARRQVEGSPEVGAYRVTLALALLRLGQGKEALPLFEGFPPTEQWPPGWRAVFAAVLAEAGEMERAHDLVAGIPRDRLKPEERALLPR
ncbi:MAG: tetratricopeptide repeat protein, partial [Verrucomicrobiia bacterium]